MGGLAGGCDPSGQNVQEVPLHILQLVEGGVVAHARECLEVYIGAGRLQDLMAPLAVPVCNLSRNSRLLSNERQASMHLGTCMCSQVRFELIMAIRKFTAAHINKRRM